jgi:hypothetical protein
LPGISKDSTDVAYVEDAVIKRNAAAHKSLAAF